MLFWPQQLRSTQEFLPTNHASDSRKTKQNKIGGGEETLLLPSALERWLPHGDGEGRGWVLRVMEQTRGRRWILLHPSLCLTSSFPITRWQPNPQMSPPAHGLSVVRSRLGDGLHLPPVPNSLLLQTQLVAPPLTPELLACPLRLPAQQNLQQHGGMLRAPHKPAPEVPAPTCDRGAQGGSGNAPGWLG